MRAFPLLPSETTVLPSSFLTNSSTEGWPTIFSRPTETDTIRAPAICGQTTRRTVSISGSSGTGLIPEEPVDVLSEAVPEEPQEVADGDGGEDGALPRTGQVADRTEGDDSREDHHGGVREELELPEVQLPDVGRHRDYQSVPGDHQQLGLDLDHDSQAQQGAGQYAEDPLHDVAVGVHEEEEVVHRDVGHLTEEDGEEDLQHLHGPKIPPEDADLQPHEYEIEDDGPVTEGEPPFGVAVGEGGGNARDGRGTQECLLGHRYGESHYGESQNEDEHPPEVVTLTFEQRMSHDRKNAP